MVRPQIHCAARATHATARLKSQSCDVFQAASAELGVGAGEDEVGDAGAGAVGLVAAVVSGEDAEEDAGGLDVDVDGLDADADGAVVR